MGESIAAEAAKKKIIKLLDEFIESYGPNGRSLEVLVKITKPNNLDTHEEEYRFSDTVKVSWCVEIGTKKEED